MFKTYPSVLSQKKQIKRVAIVAGTHGNELTGIQLMSVLEESLSSLEKKYNLEIKLFYGNPRAIEMGKRYCDRDLNRSFSPDVLSLDKESAYEVARAQELNELIGPKDNPKFDLVIDLHTTATKMGFTLAFWETNKTTNHLVRGVAQQNPNAYLLHVPSASRITANCLASLGRFALAIEIGSVMPGETSPTAFELMGKSLWETLDSVKAFNEQNIKADQCDPVVYSFKERILFPVDFHDAISAEIHPDILGRDYQIISPGTPIFVSNDSKTNYYCERPVLATFIGEPGYRDKRVAIITLDKNTLSQIRNLSPDETFVFPPIVMSEIDSCEKSHIISFC